MTGDNIDHLGVLDMFALEDGRKHHQRLQLAGVIVDHRQNRAVLALLIRSRIHTAAVEAAEHGRSQPDLFIALGLAVYGDFRVDRLEVEEQTFDRDGSIIHGLIGGLALLISYFTAVAVDAVAYAVVAHRVV